MRPRALGAAVGSGADAKTGAGAKLSKLSSSPVCECSTPAKSMVSDSSADASQLAEDLLAGLLHGTVAM
jgi:hypothetical protein